MMTLPEIARALGGNVSSGQVLAPGPGHSPGDHSLSIKLDASAPEGFLVHSFSADDPIRCKDYVRERLGLPPWNGSAKSPQGKTVVSTYDYTDEAGDLLFQVVRYAPKDFRQRRPDGNSGWLWSLGESRRVLYHLPELIEAVANEGPVFICEGEKAVEALVKLGVPATCSPGGASGWRHEYSQHLAGADVVIIPDNDEPGELHCAIVAKSLTGIAARVRVLRLPGLPPKGDAHDWVTNGGTVEKLWQSVEADVGSVQPEFRKPGLVSVCAADIKPEKVSWLWDQRLPLGKCVTVAGEGGLGKTMLLVWIAAAVSKGGGWPCGEGNSPQGSVIILSAEDDAADTLVPRLLAADANCSKIHIVPAVRMEDDKGHRSFNLQADLPLLEKKIDEIGEVRLVIIDPITSYLGKVDSHKNAETRSVLEPLGELAARLRICVIANNHVSKATVGSANNRVIGSVAFVNHARAVFIVTADPDDQGRRLFIPSKTNLGRPRDGLAYRIATTFVGSGDDIFEAPYVKWEDSPVSMTADEAVAATSGGAEGARSAKAEAMDFLRDALAGGPVAVSDIQRDARAAGHATKALRSAREALRIIPRKAGLKEGWVWELPKMPNTPEDAHFRKWAPSASEGTFGDS